MKDNDAKILEEAYNKIEEAKKRCPECYGDMKKVKKGEWGAGTYRCKTCGKSMHADDLKEESKVNEEGNPLPFKVVVKAQFIRPDGTVEDEIIESATGSTAAWRIYNTIKKLFSGE